LVLQAISNQAGDTGAYVTDAQIAQNTNIALKDVRDWIETLEGDGHVEVVRTEAGLSASITADGRLALGLYQPFGTSSSPASPPGPTPASLGDSTAQSPANQPSQTLAASPTSGSDGDVSQGASAATAPAASSPTYHPKAPVEVFYSYSHKDEALRDELEEALALLKRQGHIAGWHDRAIVGGQEWADQITEHLESAGIILLLVSSSFLASDYCYGKEMERALERHDKKEAAVIPIIIRTCDWHGAPFAKLQVLPRDGKAVTSWANKDEAWTDVARGIRRAVGALTAKPR
jgi:hypothetical protein